MVKIHLKLSILCLCLILQACGGESGGSSVDILMQPELGASTGSVPSPAEVMAKATVSKLSVASFDFAKGELSLSWSYEQAAAITGFEVYRDGVLIKNLSSSVSAFTDNSLVNGQKYQYRVRSVNAQGLYSAFVSIDVTPRDNKTPTLKALSAEYSLASTDAVNKVLAQLDASDADGDSLSYTLSNSGATEYFAINSQGEIHIKQSLANAAGKVLTLNYEVSDGLAKASGSVRVGVIGIALGSSSEGGLNNRMYIIPAAQRAAASLANMGDVAAYPDKPYFKQIVATADTPVNRNNYFYQTLYGYLVPKTSGEYTFWTSADDASELYLSTSALEQDSQKIAYNTAWSSHLNFDKYASQKSVAITLQAGKAYFIKALMQENNHGDSFSIAWQGPDSTTRSVIAQEFLRPLIDWQPPAAVTALRANKSGDGKVHMEWDIAKDNGEIDHYAYYANGVLMGTTKNREIELSGLSSGKRYLFDIKAIDKATNESPSASATVVLDDFIAPNSPASFVSSAVQAQTVSVQWAAATDDSAHPVSYRLYQAGKRVAELQGLSYNFTGLSASTAYRFAVEAVDLSGNASAQATLDVTTTAMDPSFPQFGRKVYEFGVASDGAAGSDIGLASAQITGAGSVTYSISSGNADSLFSIDNTGLIKLAKTIPAAQIKQHVITVQASNGAALNSVAVTINVLSPAVRGAQGFNREIWYGYGGGDISTVDMTTTPSLSDTIAEVDIGSMGDSYGQRVRAYLRVPATDTYTFWLASDDGSEVYLSKDMSPANKELVSKLTGYSGDNAWRGSSPQKTNIALQAGQYYYLEVTHKEGGGGDHLAVAWQGSKMAAREVLKGPLAIPYNQLAARPVNVLSAEQASFVGASVKVSVIFDVEQAGNSYSVYYGLRDGGTNTVTWQEVKMLGELAAGTHNAVLDNVTAGQDYVVRVLTEGDYGSAWTGSTKVHTVVVADNVNAGEALPATMSLNVEHGGINYTLDMQKYSVRSPRFVLYGFDDRRTQHYQPIVPMPEVRTYRGTAQGVKTFVVTGVIDDAGTLYLSAWSGHRRIWQKTVDVSHLVDSSALGNNTRAAEPEMIIDFSIPHAENNKIYTPRPGAKFHNNLARVAYTFKSTQFDNQAGNNYNNAIAQMESHLNELDHTWAQKTGLRWDMTRAVLMLNGDVAADGAQAMPVAKDAFNFTVQFQDPQNGGFCWGGNDWIGCVAGFFMGSIFPHETGHNMGLRHFEAEDNNGQVMSQGGTQLGSMQSRRTINRLGAGSKFKPTKAMPTPMLPAAFKDYLTVYTNTVGSVQPLANDYDANGDTLGLVGFDAATAAGGAVTQNADSLNYTPPSNFIGVDQLTYTVSDGVYETVGAIQIQVLPTSLAGAWDFESAAAKQVSDSTGNGNHLFLTTSANVQASSYLSSAEGSGSKAMTAPLVASDTRAADAIGHQVLPHKLDPGHKNFTASIWFKLSDANDKKLLIGKSNPTANNMGYGGWDIHTDGDKLVFEIAFRDRLMQNNSYKLTHAANLQAGMWYHAVLVIDRDKHQLKGFLNGVALAGTVALPDNGAPILAAMTTGAYSSGSPFRIGGNTSLSCVNDTCTATAGAAFDNARVYHRALSDAEVGQLFLKQDVQ